MITDDNIYDGLHVTNGPFRSYLIAELGEDALDVSIISAEDILERIENGVGRCPFNKHRGTLWYTVIQTDPDYHEFIVRSRRTNLARMKERRDRLRQTREQAEQAQAQAKAEQQLESTSDGPWSPAEIEEVEKHKWIDQMKTDLLAGWKARAMRLHPDHAGGDTEKMKQLNRYREVAIKLFPWLKDDPEKDDPEK
jgi:hypothetical protein